MIKNFLYTRRYNESRRLRKRGTIPDFIRAGLPPPIVNFVSLLFIPKDICRILWSLRLNLRRVVAVEAQERLPKAARLPIADRPRRGPDGEVVLATEEPVRPLHPHPEEGAAEVLSGQLPKDSLELAGGAAHVLGDVGQAQVEL